MKINKNIVIYIFACLLIVGFLSYIEASYQLKVTVKLPFMVEHYDTLGNMISDSLCRNREIEATIFKTGMVDSLPFEKVTNDSGFAIFEFDYWHDGSSVDSSDVERIDIEFPNTYQQTGEEFEMVRFKSVPFEGKAQEEIVIVLPMSIHLNEYYIGSGAYEFAFAVMTDMHIAEGKQNNDFGSPGYDDYDDDPNETTYAIENSKLGVSMINYLSVLHPIRFVVCTGDITHSSERSEYQRAKKILSDLIDYTPYTYDRFFYIPAGN